MGTLVKTNGNLFPTIPSLFDDFFTRDFFDRSNFNQVSSSETLPAVNIQETNKSYEIEVAAPGMNRDDFNIELNNNILIVNAHRTKEIEDKGENYMRKEFNYQQFQRSFQLPQLMVEQEKVCARYNNGILSITLPKKESATLNSSRRIEIS